MLKNRTTQILAIFFIWLLTSCSNYQDKGNYTYKEINQVIFNGLEKEYSVVRGEHLNISPDLEYTKDSKKYSYKWTVYRRHTIGRAGDGMTDISTERELNIPVVNMYPGEYIAYYRVKDLDTGIDFQYKFKLNVVTPVYEGWLLLSQVNGGSRLDMVSFLNGKHKVIYDILAHMKSKLTLKGKPKFVYTYFPKSNSYGIYVSTTGNGSVRLGSDLFDWEDSYRLSNEFISKQPEKLEADNIISPYIGSAYSVKNGNLFYYSSGSRIRYDIPINKIYGIYFAISPMIATTANVNKLICYDNTNKRFVQVNASVMGPITSPRGPKAFNYRNINKKLLYIKTLSNYLRKGRTETFAILKDENTNKSYLLAFNNNDFSKTYYGEITATDFDKATHYAVSNYNGYLFYSVAGKVYSYNFSTDNTKLVLDKGQEEITLLKFHRFFYRRENYYKLNYQLIVCSYDPSKPEGSNGTMELYQVPTRQGDLIPKNKYTGFGKIKSVGYRER